MNLTSMKNSVKERNSEVPEKTHEEEYPYGLRISLDKASLEKLEMDLPAVGSKVMITAMATVHSISASEHAEGEGYKSAELQITTMAVEPVKEKREINVNKIYPTMGE